MKGYRIPKLKVRADTNDGQDNILEPFPLGQHQLELGGGYGQHQLEPGRYDKQTNTANLVAEQRNRVFKEYQQIYSKRCIFCRNFHHPFKSYCFQRNIRLMAGGKKRKKKVDTSSLESDSESDSDNSFMKKCQSD